MSSPDAVAAAKAYLQMHNNEPRRALWRAQNRDGVPEPLPLEFVRSQPGRVAIHAATCDRTGVTLLDSGGGCWFVPWLSLLPIFKGES